MPEYKWMENGAFSSYLIRDNNGWWTTLAIITTEPSYEEPYVLWWRGPHTDFQVDRFLHKEDAIKVVEENT